MTCWTEEKDLPWLISFMPKQTDFKKDNTISLCLYMADPVTFLASNSVLWTSFSSEKCLCIHFRKRCTHLSLYLYIINIVNIEILSQNFWRNTSFLRILTGMLITMETKLRHIRVGRGLVKLRYHFCVHSTQYWNSIQKRHAWDAVIIENGRKLEAICTASLFIFKSKKNLLSLPSANVVISYIYTGVQFSWEGSSVY